jgi:hypothetical protein
MNPRRLSPKIVLASTKMSLCLLALMPLKGQSQTWRNCAPESIGPGGCDSIGPGGGQSIGPCGGLSIGPGGGLAINRDRSRGLDNYVLHHLFGLNMPNLIFSIPKFVDALRRYYEEHKSDKGLFPTPE